MKTIIRISIFILFTNLLQAQINTTKVSESKPHPTKEYDSLKNFLGEDAMQYKGQTLYLKGKSESLREYGYDNFIKKMENGSNKENIYKCCDGYNSSYDSLNKRYFTVIDVIEKPDSYGTEFYLKLENQKSNEILFFDYSSRYSSSFPFITVGYFEKNKELLKGESFIFRKGILDGLNDIDTGNLITNELGQKWDYVDLTIEQKYYTLSVILENDKEEKITFSFSSIYGENARGVFEAEDAERYIRDYGIEAFNKMLNGKVLIGFTEEMVVDTWGKPESINRASYGDQWVYDGQYLYFKDGKLESFN
ncbi:hypothetical protein ACFQ0R_01655 [Psychroflexus salinarum]|uniref:MORN repeat variant n=1 Tax=Psychroflexus salinarum TaxID=546024 RepID=A0ABW3GQ48_9FLAO